MKKFLVTILALVYIATTTGAPLHMHYCMGKMYALDMVKKDDCARCGMAASEGCCKDELKVVKLSDDHQSESKVLIFAQVLPLPVLSYSYQPDLFSNTRITALANSSPPTLSGRATCIFHCVFRL